MRTKQLASMLLSGAHKDAPLILRTNAGRIRGLSFGHLKRCAELAHGVRALGRECIFLMDSLGDGPKYAKEMGLQVQINGPGILTELASRCAAIVFDLPEGPHQKELEIADKANLWIVVLDDTGNTISKADVVHNSSLTADASQYPKEAQLFLGPEYLILSDELAQATWTPPKETTNVLLTFGGSDPTGLTFQAIQALNLCPWSDVHFTAVLGPGFEGDTAFQKAAATFSGSLEVVSNPPSLLPFFLKSTLVVCAGGRTMYELYTLGLPALAVASIEHEVEAIQAFEKQGLLAGALCQWDKHKFVHLLSESLLTQKQLKESA